MVKLKQHLDSFEEEYPVKIWWNQSLVPMNLSKPQRCNIHGTIDRLRIKCISFAKYDIDELVQQSHVGYKRHSGVS